MIGRVLAGVAPGLLLGLAWVIAREVTRHLRAARLLDAQLTGALPAPAPPVNLRLCFADGRVVPVECVYVGVTVGPDGLPTHQWVVVTELAAADPEGLELAFDELPPRCAVALAVRYDPEAG